MFINHCVGIIHFVLMYSTGISNTNLFQIKMYVHLKAYIFRKILSEKQYKV